MSNVNQRNFSKDEVISGFDNPDVGFALQAGSFLLVLFDLSLKQSLAVVVSHSGRSAAQCVDWIYQRVELSQNKHEAKLVFSSVKNQDQEKFQELSKLLSERSMNLTGKVFRASSVEGCIEFRNSKLKVEKAKDRRVRVLIVDDSKTIRDLLTRIFSADPLLEIVGAIENPLNAEEAIARLMPDVITLDIHMPGIDGVTLLKRYLPKYKIPTIMISSVSIEDGRHVLDALEFGAVDYIQKPDFSQLSAVAPLMIEKIKAAAQAKVKVISKPVTVKRTHGNELNPKAVIAIGSSTGGTEALKEIFTSLPDRIPPIVVVQHIPAVFSKAFADRLNQICPFEVKEAADGDEVRENRILIAPGGFQMRLVAGPKGLRAQIREDAPVNRHKPSVDYLFNSLEGFAEEYEFVAAILTGMGADGAKGMKCLKARGVRTIAQDEATSVVYGMPREAVQLGAVDFVLPLSEIGTKLMQLCTPKARRKMA